ncbi:MAG: hypothetical protein AAGF11_55370 [Myxococcota bacterium]
MTELPIKLLLGSAITARRPAARREFGSPHKALDEDTSLGIVTNVPCALGLRLTACDPDDEPLAASPWTIRVASCDCTGRWISLPDRSSAELDHVTEALTITEDPRIYRVQISLEGTILSSTFELAVVRVDPATARDNDDHDVLFDPQDDLKPKPKPVGSGSGLEPTESLSASG